MFNYVVITAGVSNVEMLRYIPFEIRVVFIVICVVFLGEDILVFIKLAIAETDKTIGIDFAIVSNSANGFEQRC